MRIPAKIADRFSPYLDPHPVFDVFDGVEPRLITSIGLAILFNAIMFIGLSLSTAFVQLPPEPEIIPVQIISIAAENEEDAAPAEEEPALQEAVPTPSPAPRPQPRPTPPPQPQQEIETNIQETPVEPEPIIPPEPEPLPEPESEPEPVIQPLPPTPDILSTPEPEPLPQEELEPELTPEDRAQQIYDEWLENQPEPEPAPVTEPIVEPVIPPLPEAQTEPVIEPVIPETPIIEPVTPVEPLPEFEIEIFENPIEPVDQEITPAPETEEFLPGPVSETPPEELPEDIIDAPEPEIPVENEAAPGIIEPENPVPPAETQDLSLPSEDPVIDPTEEPGPAPSEDSPSDPDDDAPIETAPPGDSDTPKVLADDDAPESDFERERAVSEDQSDPGGGGGTYQTPSFGGGGGIPIQPGGGGPVAPSGGTPLGNPGAGGWTLNPGAQGDYQGEGGLRGVLYDTECRKEDRTHEDCPEYSRAPQGRAPDGTLGRPMPSLGGPSQAPDPLGRTMSIGGPTGANPNGWASDTSGLPSSSITDRDWGGLYERGPNIPDEGGRLRDLIPRSGQGPVLGTPPPAPPITEEEEEEDPWAITKIPPQ